MQTYVIDVNFHPSYQCFIILFDPMIPFSTSPLVSLKYEFIKECSSRPFRNQKFIGDDVHHPSKYHSKLINWCTKHDGPFDIALEVGDVNEVCERVSRFSGFDNILLEPTTYSDHNGRVVLGVIKSCVGDLIHTVIDSSQYKGLFLPGYTLTDSDTSGDLEKMLNKSQENTKSFLKFIDHLAIAGRSGDSAAFINWYNTVFGLERMFINVNKIDKRMKLKGF
ncbi:4-hydroxyphenylpyruvate dioxygenase [Schistosoma japonicum]|uniref:4-hydroxyphenylpyruvate dioxygenase n=1 Tax=Schistosoma japonicum TaxID=6182 RepID=A0A4Z2DM98_SCHJA|nr:4-hydroxyphenylpyruvate dioxygenase [Schistosoma japonicum]